MWRAMTTRMAMLLCLLLMVIMKDCLTNVNINLLGVGALYVQRRPRVRLEPVFSGGGQERYSGIKNLNLKAVVKLKKNN